MSTVLDSLEIKIESNSSGAANGIEQLAAALGNLKNSGSIGTAVKNLNNLATALRGFTSVASNANKITSLAQALAELQKVGSFSGTGNSIGKLAESLRSLTTIDASSLEKVANSGQMFSRVASALAPLSGIKAGGLASMVNALEKLGKVTDSLDDETIGRFAERVATLTEKLTPLSTKMTTIQSGLKAVNSSAKSTGTSVKNLGTKVNKTTLNFASFVTSVRGVYAALQPVIRVLTDTINAAIEWDGVAARFGRGFGAQAEETYAWIEKLNDKMQLNIQTFMQYSSIYATMLTGFGVAQEDASKMALGYTELTYDIWAGYNDIYKNYSDAADAVKSAIAGEVEPIRRAGFTIVEATLEQTAANYGLEISLEKATEAQKSYLRYLTLLNQAHDQGLVGTYANELGTAEGLMRTFSQQLKTLAQSFGSLFLPILVKVIPYVQAFVELLTDAIKAVAAFFGFEIQSVDWSGYGEDATGSLGGVTDSAGEAGEALGSAAKAAEDLKKATLGIDELNVISPQQKSGGGGGGADTGDSGWKDLDVDSLWDESIFAGIENQIDDIKAKFEEWLPVLSVIGTALAGMALTSFITSIGNALTEMGTLKKVLASIVIATIEAALVFKFADDYLEEGKLSSLIGEAITTAVGSYLLYKAWGPKGLVIGIGVSVAAQLAAITLNLADGGVKMDDPELWIQAAFTTALGGVAGGYMAYKGLIPMGKGKGVAVGLLLTASLTLAAITIGDITANGEVTKESIMTGIGSVASAAGFGFMVGGGVGAVIGAGVSLAVNVIGAAIGAFSAEAEESLEKDMKRRFGEIDLDMDSVEFYVNKITAIPREVTINTHVFNEELGDYEVQEATVTVDAALEIFVDESDSLEKIRKNITNLQKSIDADNIKIALGMDISFDDYSTQMDSYISNAQSYLDQYYLTMNIALSINGADTDGSLTETLNTFYETNKTKLTTLGNQLQSTIAEAFVDGEWIPDKLEEARQIQEEIQQVLDYVSDVEYKATMQNLKLEISGTDLTAESFKEVMQGAKEAIEEKLASLEEVKMAQLKVAIMEYDANIADGKTEEEAQKIYDQTVREIEGAYRDSVLEVTFGTVDFGLDTIHEAFAKEWEIAQASGWLDSENVITYALKVYPEMQFDEGNGDIYGNIEVMAYTMATAFDWAGDELSDSARENLKKILRELKPTMADQREVADACRTAGESVPQGIREGLTDYYQLWALTGDSRAINYLVGEAFSSDPVFLNTLATVKGAGEEVTGAVREGLLNNFEYVRDDATGLVTEIKSAITGESIRITPELIYNLETMGVNMGDALGSKYQYVYDQTTGLLSAIVDSATGNSLWLSSDMKAKGYVVGKSLSEGALSGAETDLEEEKQSWWKTLLKPWEWFKEANEINSPSKLFQKGGKYLMEGLKSGVESLSPTSILSTAWNTAKSWWSGKSNLQTAQVGVSLVKKGWTTVTGWIGKIPGVSQAVSLAKKGWSSIKAWVGSIPNISQGVGLVKKGWSSVSKWVGTMPTLSAKIGLVKSGWSSIKSWLGNLNFDLGLKLPKIGVNWGTKKVAGFEIKYPNGFYTYAKGGFPGIGELFVAREAGPEMVGKIGSKTTVANNDQIVEGISEGVYAAVLAAMRASESNGSRAVNVYLDGRQVTSSVEKHQKERGAGLMGNQIYSY